MILTNKVLRRKLKDAIKMIPDTSGRITTTSFNAKVTEIENKIPDITNMATKAALNAKASETKIEYMILVTLSNSRIQQIN